MARTTAAKKPTLAELKKLLVPHRAKPFSIVKELEERFFDDIPEPKASPHRLPPSTLAFRCAPASANSPGGQLTKPES